MVSLTFYGGVKEIGGNKILLEDAENALFLNLGFPYKRHKLFFEEYSDPRSATGLLDPLIMELNPPIERLYREDRGHKLGISHLPSFSSGTPILLKPRKLVPVLNGQPEFFAENHSYDDIEVFLLSPGGSIEL